MRGFTLATLNGIRNSTPANVTMSALRFIDAHCMPRIAMHNCRMFSCTGLLVAVLMILMAGCTNRRLPSLSPGGRTSSDATAPTVPRESASTSVLQRLADEAEALQPFARSPLTRNFLDATRALPSISPRTVYVNEVTREYFSAAEKSALPVAAQKKLAEIQLDEYRYYFTKYGSPLAYLRPMELAASNGIGDVAGKRILDFGYGGIGHLRLLASLGADVTGIDADSYLRALYSSGRDQGNVASAAGMWRGSSGSITLAHGHWPKDPKIVERVGRGYDLILSKNTLKKGYIKPDRKIGKRPQIDLAVSDDSFLRAIHNTLNPGGKLIIYNLYPKPPAAQAVYNPQADARSPYTREQYEKAGLQVVALNVEDHAMARNMGRALKWDRNEKGEVISDLENNLYAMFTIVARTSR